jgi:hypothetical protein
MLELYLNRVNPKIIIFMILGLSLFLFSCNNETSSEEKVVHRWKISQWLTIPPRGAFYNNGKLNVVFRGENNLFCGDTGSMNLQPCLKHFNTSFESASTRSVTFRGDTIFSIFTDLKDMLGFIIICDTTTFECDTVVIPRIEPIDDTTKFLIPTISNSPISIGKNYVPFIKYNIKYGFINNNTYPYWMYNFKDREFERLLIPIGKRAHKYHYKMGRDRPFITSSRDQLYIRPHNQHYIIIYNYETRALRKKQLRYDSVRFQPLKNKKEKYDTESKSPWYSRIAYDDINDKLIQFIGFPPPEGKQFAHYKAIISSPDGEKIEIIDFPYGIMQNSLYFTENRIFVYHHQKSEENPGNLVYYGYSY